VTSKVKSFRKYRGAVMTGATLNAMVTLLPRYMGGLSPLIGLPGAVATTVTPGAPAPQIPQSNVAGQLADVEDLAGDEDLDELGELAEGWKF